MNRFKNISSRILSYDNKENAGEAIIRENASGISSVEEQAQ